jgi:hypothetical protein
MFNAPQSKVSLITLPTVLQASVHIVLVTKAAAGFVML